MGGHGWLAAVLLVAAARCGSEPPGMVPDASGGEAAASAPDASGGKAAASAPDASGGKAAASVPDAGHGAAGISLPGGDDRLVVRARTFLAMGGVPVRLRGWATDSAPLEDALPRAQLLVEALEGELSTHRPDSALSRLNARSFEPAPLTDGHVLLLLEQALQWSRLTEGAFDPTVGPLVALWRRAERKGRPPDGDALAAARERVGAERVRIDPVTRFVSRVPGTVVDLNAIAEGYMIDSVVALLRAEGVARAYVEVGGDLRVYDDTAEPKPFRIGVRRPGSHELVGTVELSSGALGSAGCYERYLLIGGEQRCHVIDPRNGQPVREVEGATVLAPSATDADALATALLVLGPAWAVDHLGRFAELGAVVVAHGSGGASRTYVLGGMNLVTGTAPSSRSNEPVPRAR